MVTTIAYDSCASRIRMMHYDYYTKHLCKYIDIYISTILANSLARPVRSCDEYAKILVVSNNDETWILSICCEKCVTTMCELAGLLCI